MNTKKHIWMLICLILIFNLSIQIALAQQSADKKESAKTQEQSQEANPTEQKAPSLQPATPQESLGAISLREAQRHFDWTLKIFNWLVGFVGVVIALVLAYGIVEVFGRRRLKEIEREIREGFDKRIKEFREEAEKNIKVVDDKTKFVEECAQHAKETVGEVDRASKEMDEKVRQADEKLKAIDSHIQIAKEKTEELSSKIPEKISRAQKPSEELTNKLAELSRRMEFLEMFGVKLKAEDYFKRATDFYHKGLYEEEIKALDEAIKINPKYADAWSNKSFTLAKYLNRAEEALEACEKAIELKPDDADAWSNKGLALAKLGRYEESITASDKAMAIKSDDAGILYDRACIYSLTNDKPNALENLKKAIELDSKHKEEAKTDKDFEWLWKDDEDFKKLVE